MLLVDVDVGDPPIIDVLATTKLGVGPLLLGALEIVDCALAELAIELIADDIDALCVAVELGVRLCDTDPLGERDGVADCVATVEDDGVDDCEDDGRLDFDVLGVADGIGVPDADPLADGDADDPVDGEFDPVLLALALSLADPLGLADTPLIDADGVLVDVVDPD